MEKKFALKIRGLNERSGGIEKFLDRLTLIKAIKELGMSVDDFGNRQNEIISLVAVELKFFGGNIQIPEDQKKAFGRVIKTLNLGLEYAARKMGEDEVEIVDAEIAQKIVAQKSLIDIYQLGKELLNKAGEANAKLLKQAEVQIKGLWFRLISAEDFEALKKFTDVELINGTLEEYRKMEEVARKVQNLYAVAPFFPINEYAIQSFGAFGIKSGKIYPSKDGLIETFLLSLMVVCMFRDAQRLFHTESELYHFDKAKELVDTAESAGFGDLKGQMADSLVCYHREMESYERKRASGGDKEAQYKFLMSIIITSESEIEQFSDLLFFEPAKFRQKVEYMQKFFLGYFNVVQETLLIKLPGNFKEVVEFIINFLAIKISSEVRKFYKIIPDDIGNAKSEIEKFWYLRILFKEEKTEGISLLAKEAINPSKLVDVSLEQIVAAVKYFSSWPPENQRNFIFSFNPNRFINEKKDCIDELLQFLKFISGESEPVPAEKSKGNEALAVSSQTVNWLEIILSKINWEYASPYIIMELWHKGDDRIRDNLFVFRNQFKISIPSLKDYYMRDCKDYRLLFYVLDELIKRDKLATKNIWNQLFWQVQNEPEVKKVLEKKFKEVQLK